MKSKTFRRSMLIIAFGVILFAAISLFLLGSITYTYSLYGSSTVYLKINTQNPQLYAVRILGEEQSGNSLDNQGRVVLAIPGGCVETRYIFGYRYYGPDLYSDPRIEIIKNETVIKRLSMKEIDVLNKGDDGYYELDLSNAS